MSWANRNECHERWPALKTVVLQAAAVIVLPLDAGRGGIIGSLHIGWPEAIDEPFDPDLAVLQPLAKLCAAAIHRAQLQERERRMRQALEFLHQGTRLLVSALEPDEVVRALLRLTVPRLAPWCAVYFARDDHLHRIALEVDGNPELGEMLVRTAPVPVHADVPIAQVFRTRKVMFIPQIHPEHVFSTYPAEHATRILGLGGGQWAGFIVPVEARGEIIGVLSLLSPQWPTGPPEDVGYAVQGLAARAGLAIDNARRLHDQIDNVATLSAALQPRELPVLAGVRFVAQCVPAWGGVCGDWYEAEALPSGKVLIGVGDASGHGIGAAAAMAQARTPLGAWRLPA